ncbi:MAG: 4Fe-4S binding protein [Armatimonadota bacterium]|jgi:NAD-dependent dihydropyrimidine dehydrogenase PreA subunit
MCQFCAQHGDGRKWYLQAKNYSEDLLSDLRRRDFIRGFFGHSEDLREGLQAMDRLERAPGFVQRVVKGAITRRMKKQHFGQVVPLEDIEAIFGFVNSIVRVACICRRETLGRDVGYCYGISMGPGGGMMADLVHEVDPSFLHGPDTSQFDELTSDEALRAFAEHEREGLCHSVWTFVAPFIGGICNCDRLSCMAMRATVMHGTRVMWRAEYIAEIDPDLCTGCRSCMRACQFGALSFNAADRKVEVDQTACYGCGVCRNACSNDAITLKDRAEVPTVAALW